jgi:hypothetical protein
VKTAQLNTMSCQHCRPSILLHTEGLEPRCMLTVCVCRRAMIRAASRPVPLHSVQRGPHRWPCQW